MLEIGERLETQAGRTAALKWISAFERAILNLSDNPFLGAQSDLLGAGRRRLVLRPYLIVYRLVAPDLVKVLRVVDGRRDLPALFSKTDE